MTTKASGLLWRPYVDDPIVTRDFLFGFDRLAPPDADRLLRYLTTLAERRKLVHTAVAFNAIYFGYDLDFGGYVGGPLDFDEFAPVASGVAGDSLPVGAMVALQSSSGSPLYAEVLYKEGAHPSVGADGELPSWISGAPAGARDLGVAPEIEAHPTLPERLVLDFDALGADPAAVHTKVQRLSNNGKLLDLNGHVVRCSTYPSPADAEADDLDYYATYLLTAARDQLLAGPLPLLLANDATEAELAAALRAALTTVSDALAAAPALRSWRRYAFTRASMAARLRNDGPLGGGDLDSLFARLGHAPAPPRSRRFGIPAQPTDVRYTAVGPALKGFHDAAPQLRGIEYGVTVCHANTIIGDYAVRDADNNGVLPTGVHLRLDDGWQSGGVWRTSFPPGEYARIDPLLPFGRGWLDTLPHNPDTIAPTAEPGTTEPGTVEEDTAEEDTAQEDFGDGGGTLLNVEDSHISWSVPLRLIHLLNDAAPIPHRAAELLDGHNVASSLRLMLTHDGYDLPDEDAIQAVQITRVGNALRLSGVAWPLEFFAGIVVTLTWPVGGVVLRATSTLLDSAVEIDGDLYEHRFDPRILTRDTAPGCARPGQRGQDALSLRARVLRAVRRVGLLDENGVAVLRRDLLAGEVYGADAGSAAVAALAPVVTDLLTSGVLRIEWVPFIDRTMYWPPPNPIPVSTRLVEALLWRPVPPKPTPVTPGTPLPPAVRPMSQYVSYDVAAFVRRLPPGQQASEHAQQEYMAATARFGKPRRLPPGHTFVTGHTRSR
jgi:hypothetical protein